jgi:hypothetical protein
MGSGGKLTAILLVMRCVRAGGYNFEAAQMDAIVPIWREELMHVRVTVGMVAVVRCLLAEAVE